MSWMSVNSLEELKKLGEFTEISKMIKGDVGHIVKFHGRGWKGLYDSIVTIQELAKEMNEKLSEGKVEQKQGVQKVMG